MIPEGPQVLGDVGRSLMRELNFPRLPFFSSNYAKRLEDHRHAEFVLLADRVDCEAGQQIAQISMPPFNAELYRGRFVVQVDVALDAMHGSCNSRSIDDYVDQRANVSGIQALAEVQPEAFVTGFFRRDFQQACERRACDEAVGIRKYRTLEPQLAQDAIGSSTGRRDGIEKPRRGSERNHRP